MKKIIIVLMVFTLFGCSENQNRLNEAISASKEGLTLIKKSKDAEELKKDSIHKEGIAALQKAKALYEALLKSEPNNGMYNNNYGWVLMQLKEYDEAEKYLKIALKFKESVTPSNAPEANLADLEELRNKG